MLSSLFQMKHPREMVAYMTEQNDSGLKRFGGEFHQERLICLFMIVSCKVSYAKCVIISIFTYPVVLLNLNYCDSNTSG